MMTTGRRRASEWAAAATGSTRRAAIEKLEDDIVRSAAQAEDGGTATAADERERRARAALASFGGGREGEEDPGPFAKFGVSLLIRFGMGSVAYFYRKTFSGNRVLSSARALMKLRGNDAERGLYCSCEEGAGGGRQQKLKIKRPW